MHILSPSNVNIAILSRKLRERKKKQRGEKKQTKQVRGWGKNEMRAWWSGLPYQGVCLRGGGCISSLLTGLDLRLKMRRWVKITTRIPCTFAFYVIHTHRDTVFCRVHSNIIRRVCISTLAWLPCAGTTLKLTTHLQVIEKGKKTRKGEIARKAKELKWVKKWETSGS